MPDKVKFYASIAFRRATKIHDLVNGEQIHLATLATPRPAACVDQHKGLFNMYLPHMASMYW